MSESGSSAPAIRKSQCAQQKVIGQLPQYRTHGVIPVFRGKAPDGPRVRGSPYKDNDTWGIMEKMWGEVRSGRILLLSTESIG